MVNKKTGLITPFLNGKPYHSKYSGYERLIKFYPNKKIYFTWDYDKVSFLFFPFRVLKFLSKMYLSFKAELACLRENDEIFHLYGEATFFFSGFKFFRKNKRIIATFHEHETRFPKIMPFYWRYLLKDIDIIVICPSQKKFFEKYLPKERIHMIPHGIDTHYYKHDKKIKKKKQIIAVGNYLRDYKTVLKAMELVNKRIPELKLIIVAKPIEEEYNANYEFKNGVSDSELKKLYQESLFQVLPLAMCTANNALLEGCACGLPLISINSENIKYYFKDVIPYKNYKNLAKKIEMVYNNLNKYKANIDYLSWERVVEKIRLLIKKG